MRTEKANRDGEGERERGGEGERRMIKKCREEKERCGVFDIFHLSTDLQERSGLGLCLD